MLAARDQENLVHGHQIAGASKPLNQSNRQLPPKTPVNKPATRPLKIPLNDENGITAFGGGKPALKIDGKGSENLIVGGKKGGLGDRNAFVTPMGPKSRAPLGMKTTNAKTTKYLTPALNLLDKDLSNQNQKSTTIRKLKPKTPHAENTELAVLGDKDELDEREIEYMPPPTKDLPDIPDDCQDLDFSIFKNGNMTREYLQYFYNKPAADGLSFIQRQEMEDKVNDEIARKKLDALVERHMDSAPFPCIHEPDCPGSECKDMLEIRRKAEEKYQRTMALIEQPKATLPQHANSLKGPSTTLSRQAATALSQPNLVSTKASTKLSSAKARHPNSTISSRQKTRNPSNPSPMQSTAAAVTSRNTVGYSKGRVTSNVIRNTTTTKGLKTLPKNEILDKSLAPTAYTERYGGPKLVSSIPIYGKHTGYSEDDSGSDEVRAAERLEALFREDAEEDFEFTL